ncbi:hypothetical protein VB796_20835 [Arcicella sp. LKC2W]|uniref:hypothetical protein n=1 Tax=Arcicella sp. LKC2W TaxID=2984198 RepID=UPI002B2122AE|nr:hypothetical protein [Arcicella sp. LKC2W]MEA5461525.1 hypothetical protein [Arcicella sp. LKC2W]
MKTNIENIDDLRAERARLKNQITISRMKLKQQFSLMKEELQPARQALSFTKSLLINNSKSDSVVGMGLRFGVNALLRNTVLARASWLTRLVVPYVANNFVSKYVAKNDTAIIQKTVEWVKDKTNEENTRIIPKRSLAEKGLLWIKKITKDEEKP